MDADVRVGVDPDGGLAVRPSRGSVQLVGIDGVQSLQAGERLGALPEQPGVVDDATMQLLLQVSWPETAVREEKARLEGRTAPYAAVRVSGPDGERQTIRAGRDGEFTASVALTEGPNTISMTASDPTGVQATAEARIERDSRPPSAISVEVGW